MGSELLSVLTPVYNGLAFLPRCHRTLLLQTFTNWEWIIVDDGSTDGTADAARELARHDDRIRVFSHTPNRGRGYARTRTLEHARADWSVVWDVDDFYHPHRLEVVDQARAGGADFTCSYAHIVDNNLRVKGVRGFFPFLGLTGFVHATLAGRTDLIRSIGYDSRLTTVGQIGEDHRIGLVLPSRHRGHYHHGVLMINQEDREVFLLKAIHSNGVRLRVLGELARAGVFPVPECQWRTELRRLRLKLAALNAMRVCPSVYLRTVRHRGYGAVTPGYTPSPEDMAFLDLIRAEFAPSRPSAVASPDLPSVVVRSSAPAAWPARR